MMVEWLFLAVPGGCLQFDIVVFLGIIVQYLMTWFLIAVRQEVKRIDNSVVVHALELAIKRDL